MGCQPRTRIDGPKFDEVFGFECLDPDYLTLIDNTKVQYP